MSWLAGVAYWHGLTRLRPSVVLAGLLLRRPSGLGRQLGSALHLLAGTFLFPAMYGLAFEALARADVAIGATLGLLHGTVVGALLPLAWRLAGGAERAGVFGRHLGSLTPFGIVTTHVLYGALLGYIYVVPG